MCPGDAGKVVTTPSSAESGSCSWQHRGGVLCVRAHAPGGAKQTVPKTREELAGVVGW